MYIQYECILFYHSICSFVIFWIISYHIDEPSSYLLHGIFTVVVVFCLFQISGRVFLFHPDGDNVYWETNIPFCRDVAISLECFYERLSKCTISDALRGTGKDVNGIPSKHMSDFQESFNSVQGMHALKVRLTS